MGWIDTFSEVEAGVPLPANRARKGEIEAFVKSLKVGDSFTFLASKSNAASLRHTAKRLGLRLTQRKLKDGRTRIWRIQ